MHTQTIKLARQPYRKVADVDHLLNFPKGFRLDFPYLQSHQFP